MMTVVSLLAFFLWVRGRYFRLELAKKELEQQVEDLSRRLEYSNGLKQKITMMIAHDLQSPLHFLNVLSDHVSRFAANDQLPEVKAGTEEIKKATGNIHAFVKEVNLWARSQHENFQPAQHSFSFSELAGELQQFFEDMVLLNKNVLVVDCPEDVFVYTNRDILKAILRNLIDNANKHTRGGEVRLVFTNSENGPVLTVTDNGSGMLPSELQKVRRRLSNPAVNAPVEPNNRLGYQLIADFAHTLGFTMSVKSGRGVGTTVSIGGLALHSPFVSPLHSTEVIGICQPD
ncbi:signal transduction histidine kinase [Dyadobacter sp. BE34]|nr:MULTISPECIES: HAMP domain-containing sensor histidine kinase [Dyadobacter]MDR7042727.1 signal transduction histidine kinase [Dyadobacter sp. BE242]MDR7197039.1 signal transduction histidine kinase [Dyadobacter sp. BE34]MDR7263062.1 signal transduction histidine kinase [Dyadobacter sp. BE32]